MTVVVFEWLLPNDILRVGILGGVVVGSGNGGGGVVAAFVGAADGRQSSTITVGCMFVVVGGDFVAMAACFLTNN